MVHSPDVSRHFSPNVFGPTTQLRTSQSGIKGVPKVLAIPSTRRDVVSRARTVPYEGIRWRLPLQEIPLHIHPPSLRWRRARRVKLQLQHLSHAWPSDRVRADRIRPKATALTSPPSQHCL